jgi:hypothetical protein
MSWLIGIKETYDQKEEERSQIDILSTHLLFSNKFYNYSIKIEKKTVLTQYFDFYNNIEEEHRCINIEVSFLEPGFYDRNKNFEKFNNDIEKNFNAIEDSFGGPIFYEVGEVLFPTTWLSYDMDKINVIIDKKIITLIDIDYKLNTIKKNYKDIMIKHLKFSPTKYFFEKMNFEYFANIQDIIKTVYLIINRFKKVDEVFLPLEMWEECILKMIVW